jgi:hypothetical protein
MGEVQAWVWRVVSVRVRDASTGLVCLFALVQAVTASAVDGYKEFKFGMSTTQVQRACSVPLEEVENEGWANAYGRSCRVLMADSFPFMQADREVNFVFTKKGLSTVAFVLEPNEFVPVSKTLGAKYPRATLHPSPKDFQRLAAQFDAGQPNTVIKMSFDADSIILVGARDNEGEATFLLMYTDPGAVDQGISKSAQDDL